MKLYIVIECPDDKPLAMVKAIAHNAAASAGGTLKSAFVDRATSANPIFRGLNFGIHTRTELHPILETLA